MALASLFAMLSVHLEKVKIMRMSTVTRLQGIWATIGVFSVAILLSGCPSATEKPKAEPATPTAKQATPERLPKPKAKPIAGKDTLPDTEPVPERARDLGKPLVDDLGQLRPLDPKQPVWIDLKSKQIVMLGEVCKAGYPLEFFATYSNRSYEAVVSVNVTPFTVHAGLLAIGAVPGHPARFEPDFVPPTGTEVAIEVRWKDDKGRVQSAPAQHWIRNIKTKKELDSNWVFAGSMTTTDETTGKKDYMADSGELICVLNLPTAMLDLPIRSYGAIEARSFEAFEEHLPPSGTPVTILLKPILAGKPAAASQPHPPTPGAAAAASVTQHAELEQKAVEAAGPWLALVDQEQYARSWETAAEFLKGSVDRRSFVKALNASRKSYGAVKSRQLESKQYATSVPGAPDGRYVVLRYKTSFTHKQPTVETVTVMVDRDKKWRVSEYLVK